MVYTVQIDMSDKTGKSAAASLNEKVPKLKIVNATPPQLTVTFETEYLLSLSAVVSYAEALLHDQISLRAEEVMRFEYATIFIGSGDDKIFVGLWSFKNFKIEYLSTIEYVVTKAGACLTKAGFYKKLFTMNAKYTTDIDKLKSIAGMIAEQNEVNINDNDSEIWLSDGESAYNMCKQLIMTEQEEDDIFVNSEW